MYGVNIWNATHCELTCVNERLKYLCDICDSEIYPRNCRMFGDESNARSEWRTPFTGVYLA